MCPLLPSPISLSPGFRCGFIVHAERSTRGFSPSSVVTLCDVTPGHHAGVELGVFYNESNVGTSTGESPDAVMPHLMQMFFWNINQLFGTPF